MRLTRPTHCTTHRYSRFLTWFMAVLFWVISASAHPRRRQLSLHELRRAARNLIIIRADVLLRPQPQATPRPTRNDARAGFTRRMGCARVSLRQLAGAWLRKRLRGEGGFIARVLHLVRFMSEIETHARAFATRRRVFTRLRPLILARPPQAHVRTLATPAIASADSS